MAYADQLAAIKTHALAAGAALDNKILDVGIGAPQPISARCVRICYGGEGIPVRMGAQRTLSSELVGEQIVVILWIALSNLSEQEATAVEDELYDFKHELRTRILGDSQLGGQSTDLEMSLSEVDWVTIANTRYRTLETVITTDTVEYTIAP